MTAPLTASGAFATEQTLLLGDDTAKLHRQRFVLRHTELSDIPALAILTKDAYWLKPATKCLAPKAEEYPEDMVRAMLQGIRMRFVSKNCLSLVACMPAQDGQEEKLVGHGQFYRQGDDEGAKKFVRSKGWLIQTFLWLLRWWFMLSHFITNTVWPDRTVDPEAMKRLETGGQMDKEKYWDSHPERHNRWHASTIAVGPEYQGNGVGRLLMTHVIERAEEERVIMGLTASADGELLYRKLGFEMIGDFSKRISPGGGVMVRNSRGYEGKGHDDE